MEIHTNRFDLNWQDTELVLRMIKAQYAKDELTKMNYFQDVIPQDYKYLKHLCKFDFTTEPQKWKDEETKDFTDEYLDWDSALNTLCDMCINIFDVHYHIGCFSSFLRYTEYYSLDDRMKAWSKYRHKYDDFINFLVEGLTGKEVEHE
ncbi:hypothetical protein SAMN02910400_02163 [Lachnospiraceae bacterium C10]|nr:hypothetical protein SAMN02910400_02163 [Lachnospiraceae bacterium C10]